MALLPIGINNGGGLQMAQFDSSVLGAFYSSGVSLGLNGHANKIQD